MTLRNVAKQIGMKELLLALSLLVVLWTGKECLSFPLAPGAPVVVPEPSGAMQVAFTAPRYPDDGVRTGGLDEKLAAAIDQAQESVDVAAFDFDLPRVADALVQADRRGVEVRLVTDSDYEDELGPVQLRGAGIPVVTDDRGAFMHNKFVIIDEHQTWTGSWNLTENGTYRNNNNIVIIQSVQIAANYTAEFEEMFVEGQFGVTSPDTTPHPQVDLNGTRIETTFESEGNVRERIIQLIEDTESSVAFMSFVFTDDDIAKAIIARHRAGLDVAGVIEARNTNDNGSDFAAFEKAGVDILSDGNPYALHHKVIILDEAIVITGSYNFSASAADQNDENVLIIHSPEIAATYLEEFERVYRQAQAAGD